MTSDSCAGRHAQAFLGDWQGTLMCHDNSDYKALIAKGAKEAGCMAHARSKFYDLHNTYKNQIAAEVLTQMAQH